MANFWNGTTLTLVEAANTNNSFSGSYQSIGPYSESYAVVDTTPVSQSGGVKEKCISARGDAGSMSGTLYFDDTASWPNRGGTNTYNVTWLIEAHASTNATIAGQAVVSNWEIQEASEDGIQMATLELTWLGGTVATTKPSYTVGG